jgi:hypothetical protein
MAQLEKGGLRFSDPQRAQQGLGSLASYWVNLTEASQAYDFSPRRVSVRRAESTI